MTSSISCLSAAASLTPSRSSFVIVAQGDEWSAFVSGFLDPLGVQETAPFNAIFSLPPSRSATHDAASSVGAQLLRWSTEIRQAWHCGAGSSSAVYEFTVNSRTWGPLAVWADEFKRTIPQVTVARLREMRSQDHVPRKRTLQWRGCHIETRHNLVV